jgi:hypothetical protein
VLEVNPILLGDGKRIFAQRAYAPQGVEPPNRGPSAAGAS